VVTQKVCWGLLSTARINDRIIPPIRNSARGEVAAVASRDEQKARAYADKWEISRAYGNYDELLDDPNVDAIYVSLPNHLHCEWSVRSAEAGKHVLCEKPLALSVDEVDRMEAAAKENGVVIQEAAMMRYHQQLPYLRDLLAAGEIGDVRLIRGIYSYVLDNDQDVRMQPEMGGGSAWDLGSYCVRFMRTILDDEPVEISAVQIPSARGVDLSLSGNMRFGGGAIGHFFSSIQSFAYVEADILGTTGRIHLNFPWLGQLNRSSHISVIRADGEPESEWDDGMERHKARVHTFENVDAYQDQIEAMTDSILDGSPPVIPLADSRKNTAALVALVESARIGRSVELS
jgi:predicted dehydrogenase